MSYKIVILFVYSLLEKDIRSTSLWSNVDDENDDTLKIYAPSLDSGNKCFVFGKHLLW